VNLGAAVKKATFWKLTPNSPTSVSDLDSLKKFWGVGKQDLMERGCVDVLVYLNNSYIHQKCCHFKILDFEDYVCACS